MLEDAFRFELLTPPAFDDRSLARSLAPCAPYLLFGIVIITSVVFSLTVSYLPTMQHRFFLRCFSVDKVVPSIWPTAIRYLQQVTRKIYVTYFNLPYPPIIWALDTIKYSYRHGRSIITIYGVINLLVIP